MTKKEKTKANQNDWLQLDQGHPNPFNIMM